MKYFVERADNVDTRDKSYYHPTPLHKAARYGQLDAVMYTIEKGADVNTKNRSGNTPLHLASHGKIDIVKYLVDRGADIKIKNDYGRIPLDTAKDMGSSSDTVRFLESRRQQSP